VRRGSALTRIEWAGLALCGAGRRIGTMGGIVASPVGGKRDARRRSPGETPGVRIQSHGVAAAGVRLALARCSYSIPGGGRRPALTWRASPVRIQFPGVASAGARLVLATRSYSIPRVALAGARLVLATRSYSIPGGWRAGARSTRIHFAIDSFPAARARQLTSALAIIDSRSPVTLQHIVHAALAFERARARHRAMTHR
jgi:hypothetical protein